MTKSLGGSSALSALAASTVISGSGNHHSGKTAENGTGSSGNGMVDMSKSLASFHLSSSASAGPAANGNNQTSNSTRNRAMDESVDHLFKEGKEIPHFSLI